MSTQSWQVDFDGPTRHIVAETDPQSGRVAIRVDGRMATRPMSAEEEERTFTVGSVTYILRRQGDELDLDIAPPDLQAEPAPAPAPAARRTMPGTTVAPAARRKGVPVGRIIGGVILTLVIGVAVRYGGDVVTYMRVPWKSYMHPDRMFQVNFAAVPERSGYSIATQAGVLPALQLKSKHQRHYYVVELIELPVHALFDEAQLVPNVLDAIVKTGKWNLLKREWENRGLSFIAEVPQSKDWSQGTARGMVAARHGRIYIVYAFVPRGEVLSLDVGAFLRSFDLAE